MFRMIPGLDGLRAIAFLLVFAIHTDYLQMGWVGVSLFFVLSGFLITGILLDMKRDFSAKDYFYKFYGRRFLRIFPLYYFYLVLIALLASWLIAMPFRPRIMQVVFDQIWYAVFYVYDFFCASAAFQRSDFLLHFWSLSIEEQFYVFWPLLILLVPERYLKKLFITFIVLGPVFRFIVFLIHASGELRFLAETPALTVYPLPFSHMDAFAFGAYISRFPIPRAKRQFFLLAGIIPAAGFASEYLATGTIGALSALGYPTTMPEAYKFIWAYSLLNYFFAVLIYGVAKEGWFTRFLESRPLRYLGKISYGLYIYHLPIVWFSGRIVDLGIEPSLVRPLTFLIALATTILAASLSFYLMERPIMNLKDRFFRVRPTQHQNPSSILEVDKTPLV